MQYSVQIVLGIATLYVRKLARQLLLQMKSLISGYFSNFVIEQ